MPVIVRMYPAAISKAFNGEVDWDTDTFKLALFTEATWNPVNVYRGDLVATECAATGNYVTRGAPMGTCTVTLTAADAWLTTAATSTAYAVGDIVRPLTKNGHVYRCIVAGVSGGTAPAWPTVDGQTVADGTVTWAEAGGAVVTLGLSGGADVTWGSSTITASYGIIYKDTGAAADATANNLIGFIDFGGSQSSSNGNFTVDFDSRGIFQFTTPA